MTLVRAGRLADVPFVAANHAYAGYPPGPLDDEGGAAKPSKAKRFRRFEIEDGIRVELKEGKRLRVTNRGTKQKPKWEIEAVNGLEGPPLEEVGLFFLAAPLVAVAARAAAKGAAKGLAKGAAKGAKAGEAPVQQARVPPGRSTTIGALFIDTDGHRVQRGDAR